MVEDLSGGSLPHRRSEKTQKFVQKIERASRALFVRGVLSSPTSPIYPDNSKIIGEIWSLIRKEKELTLEEVAKRSGIDQDDLLLFEEGFIVPEDYMEGFIDTLGEVLERPDLVRFHKIFFGLELKKAT